MFSVPRTSRKLKPFVDHVLVFSILDNKVWFRNYQVSQSPISTLFSIAFPSKHFSCHIVPSHASPLFPHTPSPSPFFPSRASKSARISL